MKYLYFILMLFLISVSARSQNCFLKRSPHFVNEDQIFKIVKKEIKSKDYQYIIYQKIDTNLTFEQIKSYLVVNLGIYIKYWIIRRDSILHCGELSNDSIFSYKFYLETGVRKNEKHPGFIPPILCCNNTENIIYCDNKVLFYYEFGDDICSYLPDPKYYIYRKEWTNIIRSEINRINY